MAKIAIIQESAVVLNKTKTIDKAVRIIEQVAAQGAELVVFCEAFVAGYPAWIWRLKPGGDWGISEQLHQLLLQNSVDLSSSDLAPIQEAAREHQLTVVCGINERDSCNSRATIYNSVVTISVDGSIVNCHRKLMPTNPERMVWGMGDASGLKVTDTTVGRIGSLICWESYMPLARYALYAQGLEIYIAPTYDSGEGWIGTMQHIAREGRCWVLSCGVALERSDLPADFPDLDRLYPDTESWINPGDSVIIAPGGEIVYGPLHQQKKNIILDIDVDRAAIAKRALDVTGHYARADIFTLEVNNRVQQSIKFTH